MKNIATPKPTHCLCGCGAPLPLTGRIPKRFLRGHGTEMLTRIEKIPCACGCGELIAPFRRHFKARRYQIGHKVRGVDHPNYSDGPKMKDKEEVRCMKCGKPFLKRRDTITVWNGSCASCSLRNPDREAIARNEVARKTAYGLLHNCLKRIGRPKTRKTKEELGYTPSELHAHITSLLLPGMTWENRSMWHIDHRKPVIAFTREGITDPSVINALRNLRPLWTQDNLSKGCKLVGM